MNIVTHRGLDPEKGKNYFLESSLEAFIDQLDRGFGLEFDIQLSRDGELIVIHDASLARITNNHDTRAIQDIDSTELLNMNFNGSHLTTLKILLNHIEEIKNTHLSALHVKSSSQTPEILNTLLENLKIISPQKLFLFDVTLETARYLKNQNPALILAPSVCHPFDKERFSKVVGDTLYTIDEIINRRDLFEWVWCDEWDLTDSHGTKKFYTAENFSRLKNAGFNIALVTPELHSTPPGLLGSEAHPDAASPQHLFKRIQEIISLQPDLICTDYPDNMRSLN